MVRLSYGAGTIINPQKTVPTVAIRGLRGIAWDPDEGHRHKVGGKLLLLVTHPECSTSRHHRSWSMNPSESGNERRFTRYDADFTASRSPQASSLACELMATAQLFGLCLNDVTDQMLLIIWAKIGVF